MAGACSPWEAEAGELLEPGKQRLQGAEMAPLHSSLGDRVRLYLKKKVQLGRESQAGDLRNQVLSLPADFGFYTWAYFRDLAGKLVISFQCLLSIRRQPFPGTSRD